MKLLKLSVLGFLCILFSFSPGNIKMEIDHSYTLDSLGACQGVAYLNKKVYLYGDREVGMLREYDIEKDGSLKYSGKECKLTVDGKDVIIHPTGIAYNGAGPAFMGNSIRLNKEGTAWKAVIYCIDWNGLLQKGVLDGNIINTIEDDACIQGTRPEYVQYNNKWYVATADYGNKANEVRLYDPAALKNASKTSDKGVLYKKFTCSPWVQNIHWVQGKDILILVQNQVEGRKWRFTCLDLKKSIETGKEVVIKVVDLDKSDELEGFCLLNESSKAVAVTSSRKDNVHSVHVKW
jgi:hypothetical protein